jgi:hypothetical protein
MHKKEIRKQVRLSVEDVKILAALRKKYGSSDAEIIRRGLRCLMEKEKEK